jgi:hypothetical protein
MAASERLNVVDFAQRRAERMEERDEELGRIRVLARQLGETIANAADADQWTTYIEGVDYGGYTFPLPPRPLLRSLHGGRRGSQEISVPLCSDMREIGSIRLLTIRPQGFDPAQLEQARQAAECAGGLLARAIDRASGARPAHAMTGPDRATIVRLRMPVRRSWPGHFPRPRAS